ncbi:MAG TPA: glycosyl hydrolase family 18 protein [Gammaproteobacteria bacterium]|nr:glycosyl hydrolase family 18 protein [Gammaproteobacteria bacterium]
MNHRLLIAAMGSLCLLAGCGSGGTGNTGTSSSGSGGSTTNKMVLGYYTGDATSAASATSVSVPVTAVSMDVIGVNADGSLTGALPVNLMDSETSLKRASYAVVSNFGATDFDPALAHSAMVTNRAATVDSIAMLAQTQGLAGINIDFEGLDVSDRDNYTTFITDLAQALHAEGSTLMLSVPAKSADDPNDTWSWPYDYAALSSQADLIQVMTYDEYVPGYGPGPVDGSDWMQACLKYAATQIPADKILLGLPAYGYDYDTTASTGAAVTWKDVPALLNSTGATAQWDGTSNSPFFDYTDSKGDTHEVWYEDAKSIQLKSGYAVSLNLRGVSMWALGDEDASFWTAVEAGLHP